MEEAPVLGGSFHRFPWESRVSQVDVLCSGVSLLISEQQLSSVGFWHQPRSSVSKKRPTFRWDPRLKEELNHHGNLYVCTPRPWPHAHIIHCPPVRGPLKDNSITAWIEVSVVSDLHAPMCFITFKAALWENLYAKKGPSWFNIFGNAFFFSEWVR